MKAFTWHKAPTDCTHLVPTVWDWEAKPVEQLASELKALPVGSRAILPWHTQSALIHTEDDYGLWPVNGCRNIHARHNTLAKALADLDAAPDWIVSDYEDGFNVDAYRYHLADPSSNDGDPSRAKTREELSKLRSDPRFPAVAAKLGFDDLEEMLWWQESGQTHPANWEKILKWGEITGEMLIEYLNYVCFEPLKNVFPALKGSNYGTVVMTADRVEPDVNGHRQLFRRIFGTHASPILYGSTLQIRQREPSVDWENPFVGMVYALNHLRSALACSPSVAPWLHCAKYTGEGDNSVSFGNTEWWRQLVYHVFASGVTEAHFFNPSHFATDEDNRVMERAILDAERFAIPGIRPSSLQRIDYFSRVVATEQRISETESRALVTFAPGALRATVRIGGRDVRVEKPRGKVGAWIRVKGRKVSYL